MNKLILLIALSLPLFSSSLIELIENAQKNELVDVYKSKLDSSNKTYDAIKSSYLPSIKIGASGQLKSPADSMGAGQIYNAYAEASYVVLDGFKRENIIDEKNKLIDASKYDLAQIKKDISLQVSSIYFNLQIVDSDISSLQQSKKQLQEQLKQQQMFFEARLTTEDNVARIEAAVANMDYQIEVKKYQYDEYKTMLHTLTNVDIDKLNKHSIIEPANVEGNELDSIKSIQAQVESAAYRAEQVDYSSYPTIVLSDTYSYTTFKDDELDDPQYASFPMERINSQNTLMLTFSMGLFDFGASSKQKEAAISEKNALLSQLAYKKKETDANVKLALRAIERAKKLLYASKLSQDASNRTYEIIHKKYEARVVDYVKYLDALSNKTESDAQYNRALGALQIAYANYYHSVGLDIKEYIK